MVTPSSSAFGEAGFDRIKAARKATVKVGSLSSDELAAYLAGGALSIQIGPFLLAIRSSLPSLASALHRLYEDNSCALQPPFADFHVALELVSGLRRWLRPQVHFTLDGQSSFQSLPRREALPLLEWGLNWCIANHGHSFLVLHAASLERGGRAVILPGPPGSGKSTLCAALVLAGWRLLSDELTLVSLKDGALAALARPISLKNASIALIQARAPTAVFSTSIQDTQKGTLALMKAPRDSIVRMHEPAQPAWVVFPRYRPEAQTQLKERPKEETTIELARNAFNYSLYGRRGFELLIELVEAVACYSFVYGSLDEAVDQVSALP